MREKEITRGYVFTEPFELNPPLTAGIDIVKVIAVTGSKYQGQILSNSLITAQIIKFSSKLKT